MIVLLSGPPGAGKTTLARAIAPLLPADQVMHLHTDDFHDGVRKGYIAPRLPASHAQNTVIVDACVAAAMVYAIAGFDVVVDGVIGPWFLPPFLAAASREHADTSASIALHYVLVRPTASVASDRARDREAMPMANYPDGLFEQFADLGDYEHQVVDNTEADVEQTVATILDGLAAGRFQLTLPAG